MTPAARIAAVSELLQAVMNTPKPADSTVSAYFRDRRFIGSKDRAAINTRLYRIMRHFHRYGWRIEKAGLPVSGRTLTLADVVLSGEANESSIDNLFSGEKFAPEKLSSYERKLATSLSGVTQLEHPDMPFHVRYECPTWAEAAMRSAMSEETMVTELTAMMTPATLDLRVNTLHADRDDVLAQLQEDGINATAGALSPWAIKVHERPNLSQHPLFLDGVIEVQDEGSQLVALVCDPVQGAQVVDFCAGAGGKTLALAAMMNNKGRIVAMDVLGGRLERAKKRFRRAGAHNIETHAIEGDNDKWLKRRAEGFDLVLVDAPCTGVGTWRRDPDKRWRQLGPGLPTLVPLQGEILARAAKLVKPGGKLVYATCSILPEENEKQVETFIAAHPDFVHEPVTFQGSQSDYLKITPAQHGTDGFFAGVMRRKTRE